MIPKFRGPIPKHHTKLVDSMGKSEILIPGKLYDCIHSLFFRLQRLRTCDHKRIEYFPITHQNVSNDHSRSWSPNPQKKEPYSHHDREWSGNDRRSRSDHPISVWSKCIFISVSMKKLPLNSLLKLANILKALTVTNHAIFAHYAILGQVHNVQNVQANALTE